MLAFLNQLVKPVTIQSELEKYIIWHSPKNSADVERLIKEYNYRNFKVWI